MGYELWALGYEARGASPTVLGRLRPSLFCPPAHLPICPFAHLPVHLPTSKLVARVACALVR